METPRERGHTARQYADQRHTSRHAESEITNELGDMIRACREATGKTIPQLAADVGIDRSYLLRLESQQRYWLHRPLQGPPPKQPSRDLIISIGVACGCTLDGIEELLLTAGYAPLCRFARLRAHQ